MAAIQTALFLLVRRAPALSMALESSNSVLGVKLTVNQFNNPITPNSFA